MRFRCLRILTCSLCTCCSVEKEPNLAGQNLLFFYNKLIFLLPSPLVKNKMASISILTLR